MAVLNYSLKVNVAGHHELLKEIKIFAQAQGWTVVEFLEDVQWASVGGGNYNFIAGTEKYLELYSAGYGSQNLRYRFRSAGSSLGDANNRQILGHGHTVALTRPNTQSAHPQNQTSKWSIMFTYAGIRVQETTIPEVWLFGNSKFIFVVVRHDSQITSSLYFGSIELEDFDTSIVGGYAYFPIDTNTLWTSYSMTYNSCFDMFPGSISSYLYYAGDTKAFETDHYHSFRCAGSNIYLSKLGPALPQLVVKNAYSEIRPLTKQIEFVKDTDGFFIPIGTIPIYRINFNGFVIGQEITYDSDKYLVFPNGMYNNYFGLAVQIA